MQTTACGIVCPIAFFGRGRPASITDGNPVCVAFLLDFDRHGSTRMENGVGNDL
jgi:hypothetical protein